MIPRPHWFRKGVSRRYSKASRPARLLKSSVEAQVPSWSGMHSCCRLPGLRRLRRLFRLLRGWLRLPGIGHHRGCHPRTSAPPAAVREDERRAEEDGADREPVQRANAARTPRPPSIRPAVPGLRRFFFRRAITMSPSGPFDRPHRSSSRCSACRGPILQEYPGQV